MSLSSEPIFRRQQIIAEDVLAVVSRELPWDQLSGCRIVVTGAGGFLGNYLLRVILSLHPMGAVSKPIEVVALVRDVSRAKARWPELADKLQWMRWDLSKIAVPDLKQTDYVLHAASQASPRFYGVDPIGTILPNTVGTISLLQSLLQNSHARGFLFVSSSEVYGSVDQLSNIKESDYSYLDPTNVRACYAESKRAGEAICVAWQKQHGIPTFIARLFHTYGPGLLPEDGRVFSDFSYNVARGDNIVMKSDGTARRAFCYASDAIAGIFTVLLKGEPALPYNVANDNGELSVMELAELLVSLFPEKRLRLERQETESARGRLAQANVSDRIIPDVTRLKSLSWRALIEPRVGFRRMIESF